MRPTRKHAMQNKKRAGGGSVVSEGMGYWAVER